MRYLINAGFININPYSTVNKLLENVAFLHKHMDSLFATRLSNRLSLFRGSSLYNFFKKQGLCAESFDGEDYQFITKNMDKFAIYNSKMTGEFLNSSDFKKMIACHRYQHILENLKRRLYESSIKEKISSMEQTIKESFKEINNMVAEWYIKLINIIDDWDDKHAEQITLKYFDYEVPLFHHLHLMIYMP